MPGISKTNITGGISEEIVIETVEINQEWATVVSELSLSLSTLQALGGDAVAINRESHEGPAITFTLTRLHKVLCKVITLNETNSMA